MWFKQKHSVCKQCGVHFEPVTGYEARWGDLCSTHRKPVMEKDLKRDAVMRWAGDNWERLAPQMEAEAAKEREAYDKSMQAAMNSLGSSLSADIQSSAEWGIGCQSQLRNLGRWQ